MVEAVYHAHHLEPLRQSSEAWNRHFEDRTGESITHEIRAREVTIRFGESYIANAGRFKRDVTGAIRTRLGDDRVRVALPAPLTGIYDRVRDVTHVDLPLDFVLRSGVDLQQPRAVGGNFADGAWPYLLGELPFCYGPQGWAW